MAIILLAVTRRKFGPEYLQCKPPTSLIFSSYTSVRRHSALLVICGFIIEFIYKFPDQMRSAALHLSGAPVAFLRVW